MKRIFLVLALILTQLFWLNSQNVFVTGTAEKRPDELVRLIIYADNFSHIEKTIASTYTDQNGNFELEAELATTSYAMISLGLKKSEFYVKPGGRYEIFIPYEESRERTSVFDELPLYFSLEAASDSLNYFIGTFNNDYNNFLLLNNSKIYRSKDKTLVTEYAESVKQNFGNYDDEFFQGYLRYTLASLEWISKKKNNQQMIKAYFAGKPILYSNIQYTDFFVEFFKNHYGSTSLFSYSDLVGAINSGRGFVAVDRLIAREEILSDHPLLRELIGILLIARKYNSPDVRKKNAESLLREIHRNSKSAENGKIAENTLSKLNHLAYGTQPPYFTLLNDKGEVSEIMQYRNKFLLLYFIRSECKLCTYYMQSLEQIRKGFNGELEILVISDNDGYAITASYMESRSFDWPIVKLDKEILLLEKYNIRTYPSLVLINPNGTMATPNVPLPEEGLDLFLKRYMSRFEKYYPNYGKD